MAQLKNRQLQIPGGLTFFQPETRWTPSRFSSFDSIVGQLRTHRAANPDLAQKFGWAQSQGSVELEVDEFNARLCEANGWADYIIHSAAPPPLPLPPQNQPSHRLAGLAAGADLLVEWLDKGDRPVERTLATARAWTCVKCPLNRKGDWKEFFVASLAAWIGKEIERKNQLKLSTPCDSELGTCAACFCPLELKVHTPLHLIRKHMPDQVRDNLHPGCWIEAEMRESKELPI